jgi:hypothetical protein
MTTYFDIILKELEERREYVAKALIEGSAKEYSEYRSMCGEIRGLSIAHQTVTDLVRKIEKENDE